MSSFSLEYVAGVNNPARLGSLIANFTSTESKFSNTDLILTDRRSRMKPKLFEDIAIVKFNN